VGADASADYPLGRGRPDAIRTPSGLTLEDVTLESLRAGRLDSADLRATSDTLRLQAEVAAASGRPQLAANLARAAELSALPDDLILAVYTALRPHRSSGDELDRWATRLEAEFSAPLTAAFVREAASVYAARGLLSLDDRPETATI
jgi:propanediol dehydratase small subunit